jgi:hypothetical protein
MVSFLFGFLKVKVPFIYGNSGTGTITNRNAHLLSLNVTDLDEEMLEGNSLISIIVDVGVAEVGKYCQLSCHCNDE